MSSENARIIHWQRHVAAWQGSGQSQAVYCRKHGLSGSRFSYWKRKLMAEETAPQRIQGAGFIAVQREDPDPRPSELTVRFPNGVALEGIHEANLQLVRELSKEWL